MPFDAATRRSTLQRTFPVRGCPMPVVYRPARAQDLARADELVVASINDLTERHGFGAIAVSRPTNFQLFSLNDDASGLWVAEDAGDILGFAWSWACDDLWFLAQLFVSSGRQGRSEEHTSELQSHSD